MRFYLIFVILIVYLGRVSIIFYHKLVFYLWKCCWWNCSWLVRDWLCVLIISSCLRSIIAFRECLSFQYFFSIFQMPIFIFFFDSTQLIWVGHYRLVCVKGHDLFSFFDGKCRDNSCIFFGFVSIFYCFHCGVRDDFDITHFFDFRAILEFFYFFVQHLFLTFAYREWRLHFFSYFKLFISFRVLIFYQYRYCRFFHNLSYWVDYFPFFCDWIIPFIYWVGIFRTWLFTIFISFIVLFVWYINNIFYLIIFSYFYDYVYTLIAYLIDVWIYLFFIEIASFTLIWLFQINGLFVSRLLPIIIFWVMRGLKMMICLIGESRTLF